MKKLLLVLLLSCIISNGYATTYYNLVCMVVSNTQPVITTNTNVGEGYSNLLKFVEKMKGEIK